MKKLLFTLAVTSLFTVNSFGQDLISCTNCWITPNMSFSTSTNEVTIVDMVIKNDGWSSASAFDMTVYVIDINSNTSYAIYNTSYPGLSSGVGNNQISITNMSFDLDNEPQVPFGTFRLEARINEDQSAYETDYFNNYEIFGNTTFTYSGGGGGTSISDHESQDQIGLYPNPVAEGQTTFTHSLDCKMINVYDLSGKLIVSINSMGLSTPVQLDLNAGVYLYRFLAENGSVLNTGKLAVR